MAEENQQQVVKEPKEPQRVTRKNRKKVEAGKRLAEHNHKKREAKKREEQAQLEKSEVNQYYGIGVVIALGVIGGLGYYIYQTKKGEQPSNPKQNNPNHTLRRNRSLTSLRWIKSLLYYKNGQEEYSK